VRFKRKLRAVWAALVSVRVTVTSALEKATSADPVIASLIAIEKLLLVVDPQVPVWSPVPISSIFRSLYVDAIIYPYDIALIIAVYAGISTQFGV
jgi:hypothetical protein